MAGNKYLKNASGLVTEEASIQTSAGAGDAGKIPALDAAGLLDVTMMPVGIAADVVVLTASENLSAGDFVNVWDDAATPKVRKAVATGAGTRAHGFVIAAFTATTSATVYFEGTNNQVTGKTGGNNQFLSATAGLSTSTAPTGSGQIVQTLGIATSTTSVNVEVGQPIVLA